MLQLRCFLSILSLGAPPHIQLRFLRFFHFNIQREFNKDSNLYILLLKIRLLISFMLHHAFKNKEH